MRICWVLSLTLQNKDIIIYCVLFFLFGCFAYFPYFKKLLTLLFQDIYIKKSYLFTTTFKNRKHQPNRILMPNLPTKNTKTESIEIACKQASPISHKLGTTAYGCILIFIFKCLYSYSITLSMFQKRKPYIFRTK